MNRVCYWVVLGTLRNEDLHYIPESDRCLLNKDLVFVYTGKKNCIFCHIHVSKSCSVPGKEQTCKIQVFSFFNYLIFQKF